MISTRCSQVIRTMINLYENNDYGKVNANKNRTHNAYCIQIFPRISIGKQYKVHLQVLQRYTINLK